MKKLYLIIPLIILFLSGCSDSSTTITQTNNLDIQTKCAEYAQDFFNYLIVNPEENQTDSFSNHYNARLDKCFILIKYPAGEYNSYAYYAEDLFDAIERKSYGNYQEDPVKGKAYVCKTLDKYCRTQTEWEAFVKSYMED